MALVAVSLGANAAEGGTKVGGKKALYFVFDSAKKGHSICDIEDFRFTAK